MNRASLRCPAGCRNFVNLGLENPSAFREEKNIVVRARAEELSDKIFFANLRTDEPFASAFLSLEDIRWKALYISVRRKRYYGFLFLHEGLVAESFYFSWP